MVSDGGARRVVLVSIDTLRADRLGTRIGDEPVTPQLDALAAAGASTSSSPFVRRSVSTRAVFASGTCWAARRPLTRSHRVTA